ncbi:MAG: phage major tail tube protein, partial [Rhodospirillales bacterium]|nr:phage major tail tube protein [Rhodospirillales bacterium]
MDAPIAVDMGMEAMQAELSLAEWSPELIALIGTRRRMTLRPAAMGEHSYEADSYVATLGGRWSMTSFGDLKPGNDMPLKITLEVDYFRLLKDGGELIEIDVEAGKRIVGGEDQLASMRAAMGF